MTPAAPLGDVMIADGGWDGRTGRESKVPCKAKAIERFIVAGELLSQVPNRDLGLPAADAVGLRAGDILCLGGARHAGFGDAIVEIVSVGGSWRDTHTWRPTHAIALPDAGATLTPTAEDPDPRAGWRLLVVRPARVLTDIGALPRTLGAHERLMRALAVLQGVTLRARQAVERQRPRDVERLPVALCVRQALERCGDLVH